MMPTNATLIRLRQERAAALAATLLAMRCGARLLTQATAKAPA